MTRSLLKIAVLYGMLAGVSLAFPGCGASLKDGREQDPRGLFDRLTRWSP